MPTGYFRNEDSYKKSPAGILRDYQSLIEERDDATIVRYDPNKF
jgi:hypothetical protein